MESNSNLLQTKLNSQIKKCKSKEHWKNNSASHVLAIRRENHNKVFGLRESHGGGALRHYTCDLLPGDQLGSFSSSHRKNLVYYFSTEFTKTNERSAALLLAEESSVFDKD